MIFHHFHSSNSRGFPPPQLPTAYCLVLIESPTYPSAPGTQRCHGLFGPAAQRGAAMPSHAQPCPAMPSHAQPCPAMPSHAQPLSPAMGVSITAASSMVKPSVCLTSGISEDNKSLVGPISSESNDWATWGSSFHKEELAWTGKARML